MDHVSDVFRRPLCFLRIPGAFEVVFTFIYHGEFREDDVPSRWWTLNIP